MARTALVRVGDAWAGRYIHRRAIDHPGLYRVRHGKFKEIAYIGETEWSIRGQVRALASGIFDGEMPYRDPHTASPCVWAIVDRYGPHLQLEVSVTTPPEAIDKQSRKAMEDALLALHRHEEA